MASSSSDPNAYNNEAFGAPTPDLNADGFDFSIFERRDEDNVPSFSDLSSFGISGTLVFDELFNFGGGLGSDVGFGLDIPLDQLGEAQSLDPFSLDFGLGFGQQDLGLDLGPMATTPDLGLFMQHESASFALPLEFESLLGVPLDSTAPIPSVGPNPSALQVATVGETSSNSIGDAAQEQNRVASPPPSDSIKSHTFPERDPDPQSHSPFEEDPPTSSPESEHSQDSSFMELVDILETSISHASDGELRTTKKRVKRSSKTSGAPERSPLPNSLGTTRGSEIQRAPKRRRKRTSNGHDSRKREKAKVNPTKEKTKAQKDVWHVITAPAPEAGPSTLPPNGEMSSQPIALGTASSISVPASDPGGTSSHVSSAPRRPSPRKEIFQHVEPAKEETPAKPEWFVSPPRWKPDPEFFKQKPRKNPLKPGTHSDLGWVLARLREPDCNRPEYAWSAAQIYDPWKSSYLILCGPHQFEIKTVREYDRIAYSTDNVKKLEESSRNGKPGAKPEKVYAEVNIDPRDLSRRSSIFANNLAAGQYQVD